MLFSLDRKLVGYEKSPADDPEASQARNDVLREMTEVIPKLQEAAKSVEQGAKELGAGELQTAARQLSSSAADALEITREVMADKAAPKLLHRSIDKVEEGERAVTRNKMP